MSSFPMALCSLNGHKDDVVGIGQLTDYMGGLRRSWEVLADGGSLTGGV